MDAPPENTSIAPALNDSVVYFDGKSNRRHLVRLVMEDQLEISDDEAILARWPFANVRRADGAADVLRLSCMMAPALARLEIRDPSLAAQVISRCTHLDDNAPGRHGVAAIVGWSVAAAASIIAIVLVGVPLAANRLAPLVPQALERRIGIAAEEQLRLAIGGRICSNASGKAAFDKLIATIGEAAEVKTLREAAVLATPVANAFALPGGKVFLFSGLLARAESPDEIAGVLAHELGHVGHHDNMRNLIYNGGTSFLVGLLFGDITGSGALIFASRSLITASYSREAEASADAFAIDVMHQLGRPTKSMGDLIFRVTGREGDNSFSILANHPLTEERLKRMSEEDRPPSGPPLLTAEEWASLKAICDSN